MCDISGPLKGNYKGFTWGRAVLPTADANTASICRAYEGCCQRLGEPWPATFLDASLVWSPESRIGGPAQMSSSGTSTEPSLLKDGKEKPSRHCPHPDPMFHISHSSLPLPLLVVPRSIKPLEAFVSGEFLWLSEMATPAHFCAGPPDPWPKPVEENWTGRVGGFSSFHLLNVLSWKKWPRASLFSIWLLILWGTISTPGHLALSIVSDTALVLMLSPFIKFRGDAQLFV